MTWEDDMITGPELASLLRLKPSSLRTARLRGRVPEPDDPDPDEIPSRRRPRWRVETVVAEMQRRGLLPLHVDVASVRCKPSLQALLAREGYKAGREEEKLTFIYAEVPPAPVALRRRPASPYAEFRAELIRTGRWGRAGVYPAEVARKAAQRAITIRHGRGGWRLDAGHWETRLADGETPGSRELWVRYVPKEDKS